MLERGVQIKGGVGIGELVTEGVQFFAGLLAAERLVGGMCLVAQSGGYVNAPGAV